MPRGCAAPWTVGDTTGVFQLESSGMQQLLRGLKPCFENINAAVALHPSGPLGTGMIEDFIGGEQRVGHPQAESVERGGA